MRPSIIQLKQLVFQRVLVEAAKPLDQVTPGEAAEFEFDKVRFRINLDIGTGDDESDLNQREYVVLLGIGIDNSEGKPAPYKIDVLAAGLIEVSEKVEEEKRADLATVNGASLVYGAIREMVCSVTSRCVAGTFLLPTMDFRDHVTKQPAKAAKETKPV